MRRHLLFGSIVAMLAASAMATSAHAASWEEVLITVGDINAVELAEGRQVMSYYATGANTVSAGGTTVPGGSFECAGMIEADAAGTAVTLSCVTTDSDGDKLYSTVARGKDEAAAPGTGTYTYDGGTGKWEGFTATCTYQVTRMGSGHGVEIAQCTGDQLPPVLP